MLIDERIFDEAGNYVSGDYYRVYPCGCREYTTVLSDGSLGWGHWIEECNSCSNK